MTEIGLLRHFPTEWNREGRLQGRTDIPLAATSLAELAHRRLPRRWRDAPMICSPLTRARQTAEALNEGAPITFDDRLIEMNYGAFEGRIGAELLADPAAPYRPLEQWGWDFRPPGGETPAEMYARLAPLLTEIAATDAPRLLVAHRGVMRCILARASGWPYLGPEPFRIKRASVHPVTLDPAGVPIGFAKFERLEER